MSMTDDVTGMTYLLLQQLCIRLSYVALPQQRVVDIPVVPTCIKLPVCKSIVPEQ